MNRPSCCEVPPPLISNRVTDPRASSRQWPWRPLGVLAILAIIAPLTQAQPPNRGRAIDEGVRSLRDIPYEADGHDRQKLDLNLPKDARRRSEPLPVVLWVHDGG